MPLRDNNVHTVLNMALGMLGATGQRGDRNIGPMGLVDDVVRRRAERVCDQLDRMRERHLDV